MSALDDELRATLARRAEGVLPRGAGSPGSGRGGGSTRRPAPTDGDELTGIERRAGRIRRRRTAAAVGASALAVAVVALTVPALSSTTGAAPVIDVAADPTQRPTPTSAPSLPAPPAPAPAPATSAGPPQLPPPPGSRPSPPAIEPVSPLEWPARGVEDAPLVDRAATAYATSRGVARPAVAYELLLGGRNAQDQSYALMQAWVVGEATSFLVGYVETPGRDPELQLKPATMPFTRIVAMLLDAAGGRPTEQLVLLQEPGAGMLLYYPEGGTGPELVPPPEPDLDGVVVLDRAPGASGDVVRVLEVDDPSGQTAVSTDVASLLCSLEECG